MTLNDLEPKNKGCSKSVSDGCSDHLNHLIRPTKQLYGQAFSWVGSCPGGRVSYSLSAEATVGPNVHPRCQVPKALQSLRSLNIYW